MHFALVAPTSDPPEIHSEATLVVGLEASGAAGAGWQKVVLPSFPAQGSGWAKDLHFNGCSCLFHHSAYLYDYSTNLRNYVHSANPLSCFS